MKKQSQAKLTPIRLIEDQPIEDLDHDYLGLRPWAAMIASAALGTPGPFTIGVHAGWGYGKTSLLRLAKALVEGHDRNAVTVWFNAWQYEREEHPLFPLIAAIADEIKGKSSVCQRLKGRLGTVGSALTAVGRGLKMNAELGVPGAGKVGVELDGDKAVGAAEALDKEADPLRAEMLYHTAFHQLEKAAEPPRKGKGVKIVVFVDDLDRCQPEEAVSLLESIKLVLSQPGFIFVIAVDPDVIVNYLEKRYIEQCGQQTSGRGRLYMDKIVQLPIYIPSHRTRFARFVENIVADLSKHHGESEAIKALGNTQGVLVTGASTNPRSLIRLVNNFLLDCMLWPLIEHDEKYQELTAVIASALAFDRILQYELGELYLHLLNSQELCDAIREKGLDGLSGFVALGEPADEAVRAHGRKSAAGDVLSEVARKLQAHAEVVDSLREHGSEWLADAELRRVVHEFAQTQRIEAGASSFPEPLARAIRTALGLQTDEPIPANRLGEVTQVDLTGAQVADADLEYLKGLAQLQSLYLSGTGVTDAGLVHLNGLTQLRRLYLASTKVTDAGLAHLRGLAQLKALDLGDTGVGDDGLAHLKGLARLDWLVLSNTSVSDEGVAHLGGLAQLRVLDLGGTRVTDVGLAHLKGLSQLHALVLNDTQVTDEGLEHLKDMPQLRKLSVAHTGVTANGLNRLKQARPDIEIE